MTTPISRSRGDPAAPFLAFLAAGVVVVVGVLAFLTFEESKPRRVDILAQGGPPAAFAPPVDPQSPPTPTPTPR
jgi:hypothetical protein